MEEVRLTAIREISILRMRTYIGGTREAFLLECEQLYNRLNSVPYWTDGNVIRLTCEICERFYEKEK